MNLIGNLLIAPPAVKNTFWHKTVILVTEHNIAGSMGLVLNKASTLSINDFGDQLGYDLDQEGWVYMGGPVDIKNLSYLHTSEWTSINTMRVNDKLSISSAEDILPRMADGDMPHSWRICLGVCGWAAGQLEAELKGIAPWKKESAWCTATGDLELIFGSSGADQWCNALDRSGLEFAQNMLL